MNKARIKALAAVTATFLAVGGVALASSSLSVGPAGAQEQLVGGQGHKPCHTRNDDDRADRSLARVAVAPTSSKDHSGNSGNDPGGPGHNNGHNGDDNTPPTGDHNNDGHDDNGHHNPKPTKSTTTTTKGDHNDDGHPDNGHGHHPKPCPTTTTTTEDEETSSTTTPADTTTTTTTTPVDATTTTTTPGETPSVSTPPVVTPKPKPLTDEPILTRTVRKTVTVGSGKDKGTVLTDVQIQTNDPRITPGAGCDMLGAHGHSSDGTRYRCSADYKWVRR